MFASYRGPKGSWRTHSYATDLSREMDRLLSSLASDEPKPSVFQDDENALVFSMPLPGFSDEDIEITATPDELIVSGKRSSSALEGYETRHQERGSLDFSQKHTLPCRVDADGIKASLDNGVLRIELPKTGEEARRTIRVGRQN